MLEEFRMAASEGRVGGHQRNTLWPKQSCGGRGAETVIIPPTTEAIIRVSELTHNTGCKEEKKHRRQTCEISSDAEQDQENQR